MIEEDDLAGLLQDDEVCQAVLADYHRHPRQRGVCEHCTDRAAAENDSCGDRVELTLTIGGGGTVECAKFTGAGCAASQASASLLCERVRGLEVAEAARVIRSGLELLDGAAPDFTLLGKCAVLKVFAGRPARRRCAALAWETARDLIQSKNPGR